MLKTYMDLVVRFRWLAILITVIVVGALASGGRFLSFTNDYQVFFGDNNPQLAAFNELQDTYAKNDNVLIMLEPADGQVFTTDTLQAVATLTDLAWQTPYSSRVDSVTNFQYTYAEEDDLIVENLVEDPSVLTADDLEKVKNIALQQPLLVNRLLSPTAHVTGLNINFQLPNVNPELETEEINDFVDQSLLEIEQAHPNIKAYKTGVVVMNQAFPEATYKDMQTLSVRHHSDRVPDLHTQHLGHTRFTAGNDHVDNGCHGNSGLDGYCSHTAVGIRTDTDSHTGCCRLCAFSGHVFSADACRTREKHRHQREHTT